MKKTNEFHPLGDTKSPSGDLIASGSQALFNRPQNTNFSSAIGNNQNDQELQPSQPNSHLALGSTNITAPNMEFNGSNQRYEAF